MGKAIVFHFFLLLIYSHGISQTFIEDFDDIREIQSHLKNEGMNIGTEIDAKTSGPANMMITDPDGNLILIDQHR